jgi:hypothetical protein
MTPDQQQIAIATACGWTEIDGLSAKGLMGKPPGKICSFEYLPNYIGDLNAMHEAEKSLVRNDSEYSVIRWGLYVRYISIMTDEDYPIDATASQRAEAFLRTLNLWTESQTQPQ